eukprot:Selendium_serpulae@DN6418_c0_g2_i5.p1
MKMTEDSYFKSYGDVRVHSLMLRDSARVDAYAAAISQHSARMKDAIVMDVGAGTGILSILAAKAGARRVISIEASRGAFSLMQTMIKANNCDEIVQPVLKRVEDVNSGDLGFDKVDIIISEWMGFFLLHESMLESVLFARDRWLKPGGLLFPESCTIQMSLVSCPSLWNDKVGWTEQPIQGVNVSCLTDQIIASLQAQPAVDILPFEQCEFSSISEVKAIDLRDVTAAELQAIHAKGILAVQESSGGISAHGFAMWFTVQFPTTTGADPITLSTAPNATPTHWKQAIMFFSEPKFCPVGMELEFQVSMLQAEENKRLYNIEVEVVDAHITGDD